MSFLIACLTIAAGLGFVIWNDRDERAGPTLMIIGAILILLGVAITVTLLLPVPEWTPVGV